MTTQGAVLLGLLIYGVVMLGISIFWMRRVRKPTDYLVGGRSLPTWVLAGNVTAGSIGTGVIIGASGLAYLHGWAGSAYPIGLGLGTALAGIMFAVMRRHKFMTLSEEIASYYENKRIVVEFSSITLFLSQLCWLTVQIMGGASVIAAVTGLSPAISVVVAGLITAAIAIPGGFKSVVYTDFLQAAILLTGFIVMTVVALQSSGGIIGLQRAVPHAYFSFLGVSSYGSWKIAGLIAALSLSVLADPGRRLSIYGSRSEGGARASMVIAGITVIMFSGIIGISGMYAFHLDPNLHSPDEALLWLVMNILPLWLAALVVVSITSGIFSCANGNAMAVSSFFVRHIFPLATGRYPKRPLLTARLSLVVAFAFCTVVAVHAGTIVGFVVKFLPVTMGGLAIIVVLGRFWKRSTWQGALAAEVVTPVVSLTVMFLFPNSAFNNAVLLAVPGVIVLVVVSFMTPPPSRTFNEVAEALTREREAIEGRDAEQIGKVVVETGE